MTLSDPSLIRYYQMPGEELVHTPRPHPNELLVLEWLKRFDPSIQAEKIPIDVLIEVDEGTRQVRFEIVAHDAEGKTVWVCFDEETNEYCPELLPRVIQLESVPVFPCPHWEFLP